MEHINKILEELHLLQLDPLNRSLASIVVAVTVILLTVIYYCIKNRSIPPGPRGVPYFGLYPFLTDGNTPLKLDDYKNKYGDIFSFTYAGRLYINLGSVNAIREVHVNKSDCFANRFNDTHVFVEMFGKGVAFSSGESWKILRKFFIQRFKDYGLSTVRENMAGPMYDSLITTIQDLKKLNGKPVNIVEFLGQRSAVIMRKVIFGENAVTDEDIGKMTLAYAGTFEGMTGVNQLIIGPLARLLFYLKGNFRRSFKQHRLMSKIILESVKKIEKSMTDEHPNCIVEEFYWERNLRRQNKNPTWTYFSDEALVQSLVQFVGDGILSVAAFIAGILAFLTDYPYEQDKLYTEIMDVVGPNRQPTAEDRPNMSYINAFMNEYLRKENFITFFPSLECTKETYVRGYRIPVGSITLLNFRSAHNDPETYEDPETFNPSRFLPSPGRPKTESPIVFGMGKRSCTGEPLVMLQLYLFLTTIVKNFKIIASNAQSEKTVDFFLTGQLELTFVSRTDN